MSLLSRSALREHIFKIVFSSAFRGDEDPLTYTELYLDSLRDEEDNILSLDASDLSYIKDKSRQVILNIPEADKLIDTFSKDWAFSRLGRAETAVLRLAIYEILYDDDIPTGVAINEAVELAKRYGEEQAPGFINGILSSVSQTGARA